MKIVIDLFGAKRINELYEENCRKDQKLKETQIAIRAQDRQLKGYGRDFEKLLKELEHWKAKCAALEEDRDEWIHRYQESERARKSLGEKLVVAAYREAREKGEEQP